MEHTSTDPHPGLIALATDEAVLLLLKHAGFEEGTASNSLPLRRAPQSMASLWRLALWAVGTGGKTVPIPPQEREMRQ